MLVPWLWVAGMMAIVLSTTLSSRTQPGPVVSMLRWGFWQVLSRLTFATYLVHPALTYAYYSSSVRPNLFSGKDLLVLWPFILVCSYLHATMAYLLVEQPCANLIALLQKHISPPPTGTRSRQKRHDGAQDDSAVTVALDSQEELNMPTGKTPAGLFSARSGGSYTYGSVPMTEPPPL